MLLTKLVQAREGSGLASMGTLVVQLTVVFEIYIYENVQLTFDWEMFLVWKYPCLLCTQLFVQKSCDIFRLKKVKAVKFQQDILTT